MNIWYKDINNFFDVNNILLFYPTSEMTYTEKLNSMLRLSIYISIILYSFLNDSKVFICFIITAFVTFMLYITEERKEDYVDDEYLNDDDFMMNKENECTKPTKDNPFMNVLMNEYEDQPKRKKACNVSDVKEYVDAYFNDNLYKSVDDIYNKNSSERQYFTMPVTEIPNNQEKFANWLYRDPEKTCKEGNGLKCKYFS